MHAHLYLVLFYRAFGMNTAATGINVIGTAILWHFCRIAILSHPGVLNVLLSSSSSTRTATLIAVANISEIKSLRKIKTPNERNIGGGGGTTEVTGGGHGTAAQSSERANSFDSTVRWSFLLPPTKAETRKRLAASMERKSCQRC